jgi:branched-chain amino acid transport system substrate-binding protein
MRSSAVKVCRKNARGKRPLAAVAIVLTSALALSACGSGSGGTDVVGDEITIPVLSSTTGPAAPFAKDNTVPAELAVAEYNANRPDGAPTIVLATTDAQLDPGKAVAAYRSALAKNPVVYMGGLTAESSAIAPLANKDKIPFVPTLTSVVSVATANRPWTFVPAASYDDTMREGAGLWLGKEPSAKKVVLLGDDANSATKAQGTATTAGVKAAGREMGDTFTFQTGLTDFGPIIAKIKSSGADGIVVAALPNDAAAAMKEIRRQNVDKPVFLTQSALGSAFFSNVGDAARGAYGAGTFFAGDTSPGTVAYVKAFQEKSGGLPPSFDTPYLAWKLVLAAIGKADIKGKTVPDAREAIKDALGSVQITSLSGDTFAVNKDGYTPQKPILLQVGTDGKPAKVAG